MIYPFCCHGGMYVSFLYAKLDLRLVIMLPAYACSMFASLPRMPYAVPAAGHVPTPGPPDQCSRRQDTCWSGASNTVTDTGEGLCSTDQAPESLNLCCHSLPSDGVDRPFRARTLTPLLRPIASDISRSVKGARADMCRGRGWNGAVCTDLRTVLCAASVIPEGGASKHLLETWERVSSVAHT